MQILNTRLIRTECKCHVFLLRSSFNCLFRGMSDIQTHPTGYRWWVSTLYHHVCYLFNILNETISFLMASQPILSQRSHHFVASRDNYIPSSISPKKDINTSMFLGVPPVAVFCWLNPCGTFSFKNRNGPLCDDTEWSYPWLIFLKWLVTVYHLQRIWGMDELQKI